MSWVAAGVAAGAIGGAVISSNSASKAADKQAAGTSEAIAETRRQSDQNRSDLAPYRSAGTAALDRLRSLLGLNTANGPVGSDFKGSLVDTSSGVPAPISDLYQNDPAYRRAWDDYAAAHKGWAQAQNFSGNGGFTADSDPAMIDREIRARLPTTGATAPDATQSPLLRKFAQSDIDSDPVYNSGLQFGLDEGTKAIERRASAGGGYDSGATLKGLVRFANDYGSTKAGDSYSRFTNDQDRTFGKLTGIAGMGSGATNVGVGAGTTTSGNIATLGSSGANAQGAAAIAGGNAAAGGLNTIGQYALLRGLTGGGQRTTTPPTNMSRLGEE